MTDEIELAQPEAAAPAVKRRRPYVRRKAAPVEALRTAVRQPARAVDVSKAPNGRVMARGRDGEWLTRKRPANQDPFHIPPAIIPKGYEYQWNTVEVIGQQMVAMQIGMAENGWRPVPAGRHKGMFMPADYPENGAILRDGLRLEERPKVLSDEARAEEAAKASRLVADQHQQLKLSQTLPSGFSRNNPNLQRMERSGTKREWGPAPDIGRPELPIEE